MPELRIRILVVAVLFPLASASRAVAAQSTASTGYTVKRGDTLWDIAKAVLGDSYLWPEIYRLNSGTIENPHWIYPGQQLKLPGAAAAAAVAAAPAAVVPANTPSPAPMPAQAVTRRQSVRGATVFSPMITPVAPQSRESLILRARATAVRPGEYVASPYMWSEGGPKDAGRLERSAETQGIDFTLENRPLQIREPVFVRLPRGAKGQPGEQLLVFRLGDAIARQGQVIIPTGIVRLSSASRDGVAQATLMQQFEDVFTGQSVTALDTLDMPHGVFPRAVDTGMTTRVSWLYNDPVLPTTGYYVILAASAKDGLRPGDQLSLRREHSEDRGARNAVMEEVGVAQVTRVTLWGASAIVLSQQQVGIADGMRAVVTAKMP